MSDNLKYIAHKDNYREQSIKDHLYGTADKAAKFADKFGKSDWGYCCGLLHDIGKYSEQFQKKIINDADDKVDHSTAGAKICMELGGYYQLLSYCIAGHHAGLPDYGNTVIHSSLRYRCEKKKIYDYSSYKYEIEIPELKTDPIILQNLSDADFPLSVFLRMIYSCLVDADFLDTEYFMKNGDVNRNSGENVEILLNKLENHISEWLKNDNTKSINGRRTEILKHCLNEGRNKKGYFRLTVPTGGGKTIASLAFALKHAVENDMDRVIYVIPYTSIIEQNAQVFRDILGEQNVLENHCNVDYDGREDFEPMQLASENWDKPIVVTTNVQFFESLFSNKSSKCRKLHNIANSVIIFDEAQMLPTDYLKPCIYMISELVNRYRSSIVLCTATQPALGSLFPENTQFMELCPRLQEQFEYFKRVKYNNIGTISRDKLSSMLKDEDCALCIVNTKRMAQDIYMELCGTGVFHLSTNMYPLHRKIVLKKIRNRLQNGEKCVVVSTSLVEAGVDLDFTHVYRQIAGIDSIIQAAGRCNREGKRNQAVSIVNIFDIEDCRIPLNQKQQIEVAKSVLCDYEIVDSPECISDYFERLYHFRGNGLDKKRILGEFVHPEYNYAKVGNEFKIIEQDMATIFVGNTDEAKELMDKIKLKGISKERMRKAGQFCVQVYCGEKSEFQKLYDAGIIRLVSDDMRDFYELTSMEYYSEEYGLVCLVDEGEAIFL